MVDIPLQQLLPGVSRLGLGCMGFGGSWDQHPLFDEDVRLAELAIETALEVGINLFDHADIYACGKAEEAFGCVLKQRPGLRDQIYLQSKCGIRPALPGQGPGHYDFSPAHIQAAVQGSLKRLHTEHLDVLLLHRPDPLLEPEQLAETWSRLRQADLARHLGVSNMSASQMRFLQQYLPEALVANQLEMSLHHRDWLEAGVTVNDRQGQGVLPLDGLVDYCRQQQIQLQAWAPLAQGRYSGAPLAHSSAADQATCALVAELAAVHGISREALLLAWLMRHPARIQPLIGSSSPLRIRACAEALGVTLSHQEWYALWVTARGRALP